MITGSEILNISLNLQKNWSY